MSDTSRKSSASALKERPVNSDGIPAPANPTYEEFLGWADEDTYAEWVNGKIIALDLPTLRHQRICSFLSSLMNTYSDEYDLGFVIPAPFQMKLVNSGLLPDLIFVSSGRSHLLRPDAIYLDGPADIAVEVVSPESIERDVVTKFAEYATGGVPEYWIINAVSDEAHFYRLNETGNYVEMGFDSNGRYYPAGLPGFWLNPTWLWQNPLPKPKHILRLIEGNQ
jgi:Uma2 family endonuclease